MKKTIPSFFKHSRAVVFLFSLTLINLNLWAEDRVQLVKEAYQAEFVGGLVERCNTKVLEDKDVCDAVVKLQGGSVESLDDRELKILSEFAQDRMQKEDFSDELREKYIAVLRKDYESRQCVSNYKSCLENPCCDGWECRGDPGFYRQQQMREKQLKKGVEVEEVKLCQLSPSACVNDSDCCSGHCKIEEADEDEDEANQATYKASSSKKKLKSAEAVGKCQPDYICAKKVPSQEECMPIVDVCAAEKDSCSQFYLDRGGLGICARVQESCKKDDDCCSNKCHEGKCQTQYLCRSCKMNGQVLESGEECCEGLYPNMANRCVPDIPPLPPATDNQSSMNDMNEKKPSTFFKFLRIIKNNFFIAQAFAQEEDSCPRPGSNGSTSLGSSECQSCGYHSSRGRCFRNSNDAARYNCGQDGHRWYENQCWDNEQEYCDRVIEDKGMVLYPHDEDYKPSNIFIQYDSDSDRCMDTLDDAKRLCESTAEQIPRSDNNTWFEESGADHGLDEQGGRWDGTKCIMMNPVQREEDYLDLAESDAADCEVDENGVTVCRSGQINTDFTELRSKSEVLKAGMADVHSFALHFDMPGNDKEKCLFNTRAQIYNRMSEDEKVMVRLLESFEFVAFNPNGMRDYYRQEFNSIDGAALANINAPLTLLNQGKKTGLSHKIDKLPSEPWYIGKGKAPGNTNKLDPERHLDWKPRDFKHPELSIKGRLHTIAADLKAMRLKKEIQYADLDRMVTCACVAHKINDPENRDSIDPLVRSWAFEQVGPRDLIYGRIPADPVGLRAAGYGNMDDLISNDSYSEEAQKTEVYNTAMTRVLERKGILEKPNCPGLKIEDEDKFSKQHRNSLALEYYRYMLNYMRMQREFMLDALKSYTELYEKIFALQAFMGGIPELDSMIQLTIIDDDRGTGANRSGEDRNFRDGEYGQSSSSRGGQESGDAVSLGPWGSDIEKKYWGLHHMTKADPEKEYKCSGTYYFNWRCWDIFRTFLLGLLIVAAAIIMGPLGASAGIVAITILVGQATMVAGPIIASLMKPDGYEYQCKEHKSDWKRIKRRRIFKETIGKIQRRYLFDKCSGYLVNPYCGGLVPGKFCIMSAYSVREYSEDVENTTIMDDDFRGGGFLLDPFIPMGMEYEANNNQEVSTHIQGSGDSGGKLDNKHFFSSGYRSKGRYEFKHRHLERLEQTAKAFVRDNRLLGYDHHAHLATQMLDAEGAEPPGEDEAMSRAVYNFAKHIVNFHFFMPSFNGHEIPLNPAPGFVGYVDMVGFALYAAAREVAEGVSADEMEKAYLSVLRNYDKACQLAAGGTSDISAEKASIGKEGGVMNLTGDSALCNNPETGEYEPAFFERKHQELKQQRVAILGDGINANFSGFKQKEAQSDALGTNTAGGSLGGGAAGNFGRRERMRKAEFDHYMKVRGNTPEGQRSIQARAQQLDRMMSPLGASNFGTNMFQKAGALSGDSSGRLARRSRDKEEDEKEKDTEVNTAKADRVTASAKKPKKDEPQEQELDLDALLGDLDLGDLDLDGEGGFSLNAGNDQNPQTYVNMLQGAGKEKEKYQAQESDGLFELVTKAYVRSLPRILIKKKKPQKEEQAQSGQSKEETSKLKKLLNSF